jgi:glycosyltransferase involved in cell wall biosynthesis
MPTHNRPGWLERAAKSVLDQNGGELELVIVDDASSDDTPLVAEKLADDPRVRLVRNATSVGPGGSRNQGIAAARGDLLGFCDDDDTWLPGAAAVILEHFDSHADIGVVTSWHQVVHDQSDRTAVFRGPLAYGADQLLWFNFVALPFGVIRREMFSDDLAVDVTLPSCEDWDLWLRCALTRPIGTVPAVLYAYHQHSGNRVTREGSGDVVGRRRFLEKHSGLMVPSCRLYHELVVAQLGGGRRKALEQLAADYRAPAAAAIAGSLLAANAAASSIGMRRADPGLSARVMANLVGKLARPRRPAAGGR